MSKSANRIFVIMLTLTLGVSLLLSSCGRSPQERTVAKRTKPTPVQKKRQKPPALSKAERLAKITSLLTEHWNTTNQAEKSRLLRAAESYNRDYPEAYAAIALALVPQLNTSASEKNAEKRRSLCVPFINNFSEFKSRTWSITGYKYSQWEGGLPLYIDGLFNFDEARNNYPFLKNNHAVFIHALASNEVSCLKTIGLEPAIGEAAEQWAKMFPKNRWFNLNCWQYTNNENATASCGKNFLLLGNQAWSTSEWKDLAGLITLVIQTLLIVEPETREDISFLLECSQKTGCADPETKSDCMEQQLYFLHNLRRKEEAKTLAKELLAFEPLNARAHATVGHRPCTMMDLIREKPSKCHFYTPLAVGQDIPIQESISTDLKTIISAAIGISKPHVAAEKTMEKWAPWVIENYVTETKADCMKRLSPLPFCTHLRIAKDDASDWKEDTHPFIFSYFPPGSERCFKKLRKFFQNEIAKAVKAGIKTGISKQKFTKDFTKKYKRRVNSCCQCIIRHHCFDGNVKTCSFVLGGDAPEDAVIYYDYQCKNNNCLEECHDVLEDKD